MNYKLKNYDTWLDSYGEDHPETDDEPAYDDGYIDYQIDKLEDRRYDDYNR